MIFYKNMHPTQEEVDDLYITLLRIGVPTTYEEQMEFVC